MLNQKTTLGSYQTTADDPVQNSYVTDNLLNSHGHNVLRLPPYNSQCNPIELAWSATKTFYNKHIKRDMPGSSTKKTRFVWREAL
jgi:transposase